MEEINDDDLIEVIEEVGEKTESGEVEGDEDSKSPRQQKRHVFLQVRVRYLTLVYTCCCMPYGTVDTSHF